MDEFPKRGVEGTGENPARRPKILIGLKPHPDDGDASCCEPFVKIGAAANRFSKVKGRITPLTVPIGKFGSLNHKERIDTASLWMHGRNTAKGLFQGFFRFPRQIDHKLMDDSKACCLKLCRGLIDAVRVMSPVKKRQRYIVKRLDAQFNCANAVVSKQT